MSAINELQEILEQTQTASFVTTMLRDISATKLQSVREEFDRNHEYFIELHELMALVQERNANYQREQKETVTPQRMYVALTSNKRFYGTLNHQIIHEFNLALQAHPEARGLVIGQTGKQIVENSELHIQPEYVLFKSDTPSSEDVLTFVQKLVGYTEIYIIHPTFINSFVQKAKTTDLTHTPPRVKKEEQKEIDYLFEPEIPKIIEFFKTQIRLVLFNRVLLETTLALTGARLMKMQRARERAEELLKQQRRTIHKEISTVQSMRLLEAFAGFKAKDTI